MVLGSLERLNDGLIGYFLPGVDGPDFSTLYAAAATGDDPRITAPAADTLTLRSYYLAPAPTVTMLVDPRCSVHAFSGVAPVKEIDIPSELYADALARMTFTFLTSPVLCPPGPLAMPVPAEGGGSWSWVAWGGAGWAGSPVQPPSAGTALEAPLSVVEGWLKLTPTPENTQ